LLKVAQCIPWSVIRDGITGGSSGVQPFNIMILFFSLAYLAISLGQISLAYTLTLDLTGILQSAAFWVSNRGGTSGRRLFLYFYLMTTGLSSILGNDPVILSGTAFLVYFTKVAEVKPVAWLFSEFASCNTASMLLFVGDTPPEA
jgi:Na+/H+ antiporter NhaD/arsenite permease-like protein